MLAAPVAIDIPAAPIAQSLRRLSALTGASIGVAGRLPALRTRPVRGARSAGEALAVMFEGSGWRAVAVGQASFRIEPANSPARPGADGSGRDRAPPPAPPEQEIVVTALKRPTWLADVPATVHLLPMRGVLRGSAPGRAADVAAALPSLTSSGTGPGRDRYFLRGLGDGPLGGFDQGSVAVLIDEGRLNYDAPDPDWALVDIDRVEVLEGPQGPLYGSGALGGIVKIVTNRAALDETRAEASAGVAVTASSGLSTSLTGMLNLPLVTTRVALRAVGYRSRDAGWIDNAGGRADVNSEALGGGRLSLAVRPVAGWRIDLTGAVQRRNMRDSQYLDGRLGGLRRPARLPEPHDSDAALALATVSGSLGSLSLTSVTSFSRQESDVAFDASPLAPILGTAGATLVHDSRRYTLFDQEIRLASKPGEGPDWLAGASFMQARTDVAIVARSDLAPVSLLASRRSVAESAIFGEAGWPLGAGVSLSAGGRLFSTLVEDEGSGRETSEQRSKRVVRASGSLGLSWKPSPATTVFARAATAFRPGGLNIVRGATRPAYDADELLSLEAGVRSRIGAAVSLDLTVYGERWRHAQADELLADGLVATRNVGNARTIGAEGRLRWSLGKGLGLDLSAMAQSARLEGGGGADIDDPRIPAVPELALRGDVEQRLSIAGWHGTGRVGLRYTGATHLSFDPTIDRRARGRLEADAGLALVRDGWSLGLSATNLTNRRSDVFPFGNPFRVRAEPQRTPPRPRTLGLTIGRDF